MAKYNELWIFGALILIVIVSAILVFKYYQLPEGVIKEESEPEGNMYMVSHSEYWSGEEGQIITRLLNYQGQPITDANCTVDIFYPDKTYFKQNELTNFTGESHYYNFTTPTLEGVYEYKAICIYDGGTKNRSVMNSFHLSPALNFIQISYDNLSNEITDLTDLNNVHFGNLTINLSQIKDDTQYIRDNLGDNVTYQSDVLERLDFIADYCTDTNTSESLLCQWVNETRLRVADLNITVDSIPPTVEISVINPSNVALGSNVNVNIQWIAIDGNLQNYYINITYPNGTLLVQTTSFDYDVSYTLLDTNGTYNVEAYAIDTYTNVNTASSSFTVLSGVTITDIIISTPCSSNCQVNFTLVDADSSSVDITALDWTLLQGSFPIQNSSLYLTGLDSSPGGIKHSIIVDTTTELGNNIYPGVRIKITISSDDDYSNYFLVDNQNIDYEVWNYNGRYIHGELLN